MIPRNFIFCKEIDHLTNSAVPEATLVTFIFTRNMKLFRGIEVTLLLVVIAYLNYQFLACGRPEVTTISPTFDKTLRAIGNNLALDTQFQQ